MTVLRKTFGEVLRAHRVAQGLTLREVSERARVSLGYISELERGQKEASSELLGSLTDALGISLSHYLRDVSDLLALEEAASIEVIEIGQGDGARAFAA